MKKISSKRWYFYAGLGILALFFVVQMGRRSGRLPARVLSESTLLADHGSDSGGSGSDSGGNGGGSGSVSSGGSSGESRGGGQSGGSGSGSGGERGEMSGSAAEGNTVPSTMVECIGPDGHHFQTAFRACEDLNKSWNNFNWTFNSVRVSGPKIIRFKTAESETEMPKKIEVAEKETEVRVKMENDEMVVKVKKTDGSEVELEQEDALEKLNKALEGDEIKVSTASANNFVIKKGEVEAETHFPLNINLATHTLTVTTPAGVRAVTVLPDAAVASLIRNNIITNTTERVELLELDNQAVFRVQGASRQRLLGIIAVDVPKTSFVSAQNGQILRIDETPGSRLLDLISL